MKINKNIKRKIKMYLEWVKLKNQIAIEQDLRNQQY